MGVSLWTISALWSILRLFSKHVVAGDGHPGALLECAVRGNPEVISDCGLGGILESECHSCYVGNRTTCCILDGRERATRYLDVLALVWIPGENIVEAVLETRPSAHACFVALVIDVDVSSTSGHFIAFALSANMRKHVAECTGLLHHSIRLGMCHGKIVYLQPLDRRES